MREPVQFGDYKLVKRLAVSSMSEVFLAFPVEGHASSPVIVKRLLDEVAAVDAFVNLFHNEAELASFMEHPNTVRFLDFGEADGLPFLVMEYVEGLDLWRLTRRLKRAGQNLPPSQAIYIIAEVLKALGYVHDLEDENGDPMNIVHHDVSPSNILLGRNSEVKLGDFGIAYSEQQNLENLGRKFKGKVYYLSPEQVKGVEVDHRSDIYSAGVVLTELILGKRPFTGPTDLSVLINVRDRHSPVLDEGLETLPTDIAMIIDRSLATDPDTRYQDADSFREDLESVLEPGDLDRAILDLPETLKSVERSTDGLNPIARPRSSGYDLYRAMTTPRPFPVESETATGEKEPGRDEDDLRPTPVTPIRMITDYEVKKADGEPMGVMPMSGVIEGIICGRIQEDDLISVNGETYQTVTELKELSKHLPSITQTERRHDLGLPDLRGLLAEKPVFWIFLDMYLKRETGLLIFDCNEIHKDVYIEEGTPRYISSNVASELLGEYLVRLGSISRMELDMALAVMDRYEGHLGDTLLGLDIMDSISLLRDITRQIKERLQDLYTWQEGEYHFYRKVEHLKKDFRLSVDPLVLIKESCLAALEREDMETWYERYKENILSIDSDTEIPLAKWKFPSSYQILLTDLEQKRSLVEIMEPYKHASPDARSKLLRAIKFGTMVGFISGIERVSITELSPGEQR